MSSDESTWGVQPNGFVCPTQQEILENLADKLRLYVDPKIDLAADSVEGQKVGIVSRQLALAWETLRALYVSRSRDGAENAALDEIGKLTGTSRPLARATTVLCDCVLAEGTQLTADESLASVVDDPDVTLTPVATFVAPFDGTYSVLFKATQTGPIVISSHTVTTIQTPITGWTSVDNPTNGTVGQEVSTDAEYRQTQELDLTQAGSGTVEALAADLVYDAGSSTGVPGVIACTVVANVTDYYDAAGLPPHSIEVLILDDGTVDTAVLARAIYEGKSATAGTHGSYEASFVDDKGVTRTVKYSTKTQVPIYITYNISTGDGYIGDTALKQAIVDALSERLSGETTVPFFLVAGEPFRHTGVIGVSAAYLGTGADPSGTVDVVLTSARQIPTFSTARIILL